MTVMTVVGYVLIAVAAIWLLYKLYVSYTSGGGTDLMVPVYDAAMYPPMLCAFGLYWVLPTYGINWSIWIYVGLWLGLTVTAVAAIRGIAELGDRWP